MRHAKFYEVTAHLLVLQQYGELLVQPFLVVVRESVMPVPLDDLEARLEDFSAEHLRHVGLERFLVALLLSQTFLIRVVE